MMRPAHDWLNRVAEKHRQFSSLQLSSEQKVAIERWIATRFVYATLNLENLQITEEKGDLAVTMPDLNTTSPITGVDASIRQTIEGLRLIVDLVQSKGVGAALTPDLLFAMHGTAEFRKTPSKITDDFKTMTPEYIVVSVESACGWFSADSFAELNPIEQASIAHLRLLEIQPFEEGNQRTAILAASFFTVRGGLPPLIIEPASAGAYRVAIGEASRGNTKPIVEFVGETIEETLSKMIPLAQ